AAITSTASARAGTGGSSAVLSNAAPSYRADGARSSANAAWRRGSSGVGSRSTRTSATASSGSCSIAAAGARSGVTAAVRLAATVASVAAEGSSMASEDRADNDRTMTVFALRPTTGLPGESYQLAVLPQEVRPKTTYDKGGMVEANRRYHAPDCACTVHQQRPNFSPRRAPPRGASSPHGEARRVPPAGRRAIVSDGPHLEPLPGRRRRDRGEVLDLGMVARAAHEGAGRALPRGGRRFLRDRGDHEHPAGRSLGRRPTGGVRPRARRHDARLREPDRGARGRPQRLRPRVLRGGDAEHRALVRGASARRRPLMAAASRRRL